METNKAPLCVFCLSPSFTVLPYQSSAISAPKRPAISSLRRGECSYPRIRPRFKPNLRRGTDALAKYLLGRVNVKRRETSLKEVLGALKEVWISPNNKFKSLLNSNNDMDPRRKISSVPSSENYSPVLLRRRLSAPETIMRKHTLAQQRTESQDSDATQTSECKSCQLRMDIGSDSNLSKKRDLGLMRKSTLLKRLWGNSKSLIEKEKRFPGAYSEWQYTCGKLSVAKSTHSLNSVHSSPEHLKTLRSLSGEEFRTTSLSNSRKVSPKHVYEKNKNVVKTSPMRKISICNANQDMNTHITYKASISNISRSSSVTTSGNRISTTNTPKTTDSDTSTRRTNTSTTIYSDNSDSAYTNSRCNFSTNNNSETTCSSRTQTYTQENTEINENLSESEFTLNINTVNMFNNNNSKADEKHININESSTQTTDTANLNVISNVQLSQSTLNLIFDQVLQDVQNKQPNVININTLSANIPVKEEETISEAKVINVQQIPSFYLNRKDDSIISPQHNQIIKYMISNVGTGSAYSKPAEVPQIVVPRFSALPRSASMEVNTSSGDSTDKESDTVSLVDSLEDPFSPRNNNTLTKYDEKPVRGDLSLLLPDNSDKRKSKTPQKPSAFFIPIESDKKQEGKSVADHLPARVKEKLSKRQFKREQKVQYAKSNLASPRSDSNYISASDTGNQITFSASNSDYVDTKCAPILSNPNKTTMKMKTILPNIQTFKRDSKDTTRHTEREKFKDNFNKPAKRKSFSRYDKLVDNLSTNLKTKPHGYQSHAWVPKSRTRENTPIRSELLCDLPRRVYHKSELNNLNKRVEILEIMEYVNDERNQNYNKGKSKIPILVPQKLPKIERKSQKPTYLDFDKMHVIDPKIDRLIANILIDTLKNGNSSDDKNHIFKLSSENIAHSSQIQSKHSGNKYQQIFEVIPEELSLQSSAEINTNINKTTNGNIIENKAHSTTEQITKCNKLEVTDTVKSTDQNQKPCKGKEAISMDDDSLTVPQGWITFYMLHKNQGSPDSTSDEGSNKSEKLIKSKTNAIIKKKMNGGTKNSEEPHVQIQEKQINDVPEYNYGAYKMPKKDKHDTTIAGNVSSSDTISDNVNLSATSNVARIPKKNVFRKNNKNVNNDRNKPNGWSVTVTGTSSYGQVAPNVEMRLKFPLQNEYGDQCQSDSGFGEERITENLNQSCHLTKRSKQNICGSVANANTTEDNYKNGRLPTISQKNQKHTSKRCDSSLSSSMVPMEPRQTKTSTRRYILNRPRNVGPASPNLDKDLFFNLNAEKQLAAILSRFPDILSVSGNGINPEHKPKVTTMSERDITRQVYANPR